MRRFMLCVSSLMVACTIAGAAEGDAAPRGSPTQKPNSVMVFGGPFTLGFFGESFVPFIAGIEGTVALGGSYQRLLHETPRGYRLGAELGAAARLGAMSSAEGWMGLSLGYRGWKLGKFVASPQFVLGLSTVTGPSAMEVPRINQFSAGSGDPTLLFYLGPEIAFHLRDRPDLEFVYRVHHRSGGWHLLGNVRGGNNAQVFGIRRRF